MTVACDDDGGSSGTSDTGPVGDTGGGGAGGGTGPDQGPDRDGAVSEDTGPQRDDAEPPVQVTPDELGESADVERLGTELEFIARPRRPGTPHWQAVQTLCAETFEANGFVVERHEYGTGVNIIGTRRGVSRPDEQVILSAHYDHIHDCAGADDNATGTAAVLEAARILGQQTFARTLVVACWDEEERGLIGSRAYADRAALRGERFHANYVLEMLGYRDDAPGSQVLPAQFDLVFPEVQAALEARDFRGDFLAVIADDINRSASTDLVASGETFDIPFIIVSLISELRTSPLLADLRRSDHAPFWDHGYPGIMVTDTANFRNPYYHCVGGEDDITTVDVEFVFRATQAAISATAKQLQLEEGEVGEMPDWPPELVPPGPDCSPMDQDCPNGDKCALVYEDNGEFERCVPAPADGAALGEACTRPDGIVGIDTCADTFCAFWGLPRSDPQQRYCLPYCRRDEDCASGGSCLGLGTQGRVGVCGEPCTLFGDDCREGTTCGWTGNVERDRVAFYCKFLGEVGTGGSCGDADCVAHHTCLNSPNGPTCFAMCDAAHPCPQGQVCNPTRQLDAPEGFGHC